eukprot:scaffold293921_cov32-Tisochrysis_lutea.AAC.2
MPSRYPVAIALIPHSLAPRSVPPSSFLCPRFPGVWPTCTTLALAWGKGWDWPLGGFCVGEMVSISLHAKQYNMAHAHAHMLLGRADIECNFATPIPSKQC